MMFKGALTMTLCLIASITVASAQQEDCQEWSQAPLFGSDGFLTKGVDYQICAMKSPLWSYVRIRNETASPVCFTLSALEPDQKWEHQFLKAGGTISGFMSPRPNGRYRVDEVTSMPSKAIACPGAPPPGPKPDQ
jgi:hypothetical protein